MIVEMIICILLFALAVVAVYATTTMLTYIFKGVFKLAPLWVRITSWVMATIGASASALFIYGIVELLLTIV